MEILIYAYILILLTYIAFKKDHPKLIICKHCRVLSVDSDQAGSRQPSRPVSTDRQRGDRKIKPIAREMSTKREQAINENHGQSVLESSPDKTLVQRKPELSSLPHKSIVECGEMETVEEVGDVLGSSSTTERIESDHVLTRYTPLVDDSNQEMLLELDDDQHMLADDFYKGEFVLDQDICVGRHGLPMTKELINLGFTVNYKDSSS